MGHYNPDNRSDGLPEIRSRVEAPASGEPKLAAVGSLMSVQIRRNHVPRKRAPSGSAPSSPAETPVDPAVAPPTQQPAVRAAQPLVSSDQPRRKEEIVAYWTRLRGKQPYPAVSDLDLDLIAADWPNSIMFRCRAGSGALMPDMSFLPRQDDGRGPNVGDGKIQLSPMMLQWLVSLAEDAIRDRRPVEDLESFPSAQKAIGYSAVALPLSTSQSEIDHVLCHVKYTR